MTLILSLSNSQLIEITETYGTPLFIYDGDLILRRYKELYDFIKWPKLQIFYAMKANYNVGILNLLREKNAFIDTVSPGEVHLALKAGFTPDRLLYTANNLTDDEMREVQASGILFNIDSLPRLKKFGIEFPGSEICLRFNPDVIAGADRKVQTAGPLTKFGILMKDVPEVKRITNKYQLRVVWLHEHTGSGIKETEKFYQSMKNLLSIAKRDDFPDLEFIDFGGGFHIPSRPDEERIDYGRFGEKSAQIFKTFCQGYGKELIMRFEPGKYIVSEAGFLVIQVNTLKNNRGRLIAGTNSGFPHTIPILLYDRYKHILNLSNPDGLLKKYDVCGNICESGDRFAEQRKLPEIREGDYLAIQNAGAYSYSMGGVYNLRPMPGEVLVINGKPKLTRARLSNKELAEKIWAN